MCGYVKSSSGSIVGEEVAQKMVCFICLLSVLAMVTVVWPQCFFFRFLESGVTMVFLQMLGIRDYKIFLIN